MVRALLFAALLFAGSGAALATAPAALAHDELVSSTPAAGARLETAPTEIELTFSSALTDLGNQIQVLDADGRNWAEAGLVLNRETLVQPLPANMPNGEYSALWRAVSSDGHPITGSFEFVVGADVQPGPATTPADSGAAGTTAPGASTGAPESTDATGATGTPGATDTAEATDASANDDGGRPAWLLPGIFGGLTGLVLYAVYTVVSRRRRRQTGESSEE